MFETKFNIGHMEKSMKDNIFRTISMTGEAQGIWDGRTMHIIQEVIFKQCKIIVILE